LAQTVIGQRDAGIVIQYVHFIGHNVHYIRLTANHVYRDTGSTGLQQTTPEPLS